MIKRNSILIIGNGFDIAHGLPTKYSDFADSLIEKIAEKIVENENSLFNEKFKVFNEFYHNRNKSFHPSIHGTIYRDVISTMKTFGKEGLAVKFKSNLTLMCSLLNNNFLKKLYSNSYTNWFDIENAFFGELVSIKNEIEKYVSKSLERQPDFKTNGRYKEFIQENKEKVQTLNNNLNEIKMLLKEYLISIDIEPKIEIRNFFKRFFKTGNGLNIQVVNFNYTNTINLYRKELSNNGKNQFDLINIHGSLDSDIIFGYGNDQNNDFQIMKDLEIDEFLENFKTYDYLDNNTYREFFNREIKLLGAYDVYVIGHSLQLTDKTLLSKILNNGDNCCSVEMLLRGDLNDIKEDKVNNVKEDKQRYKEYRKLLFAISRIIQSENDELRLKVVDYKNSNIFPK